MLVVRQSIVAGVNRILGTYCKGAVHKEGDTILASDEWIECWIFMQIEEDLLLTYPDPENGLILSDNSRMGWIIWIKTVL